MTSSHSGITEHKVKIFNFNDKSYIFNSKSLQKVFYMCMGFISSFPKATWNKNLIRNTFFICWWVVA